jgi:hypothetical protein
MSEADTLEACWLTRGVGFVCVILVTYSENLAQLSLVQSSFLQLGLSSYKNVGLLFLLLP